MPAGATPDDAALDPGRLQAICAGADPVRTFCGEASLWGELAGSALLEAALRRAARRDEHSSLPDR